LCFLLLVPVTVLNTQEIVINEFMAANDTIITDENGDYSDWVELYNKSESDVNLSGFGLSDTKTQPFKWTIPDLIIKTGHYLVIWCSGKDRKRGELHSNFKLNKETEYLSLIAPEGVLHDSLSYSCQKTDFSMGRFSDGEPAFFYFKQPTPGRSNNVTTSNILALEPHFSPNSGLYGKMASLNLSAAYPEAVIYYSLDSSEPTSQSTKYQHPILIDRTTVVRARTYLPPFKPSPVRSKIFILNIDETITDLPILALITEPENLWDPKSGIYANPKKEGRDWERPVELEYFSEKALFEFSLGAGLRIHGGASRGASSKKSFRLYFRSDYGAAKLEFPILPATNLDQYDVLILRGGFNDSWPHRFDYQRKSTTYLRDQFVMDLFRDMGYISSHGDFLHLFLNGEYWGLYNIIERFDDEFMDFYAGNGEWRLIIAREFDDATNEWQEFENWFSTTNFAVEENFEALKRRVDINNLVDYYILNIWIQNLDWPDNNWYAAKNTADPNSRWIFLPWDSEHTLGGGWGRSRYNQNILDKIKAVRAEPLGSLFDRLRKSTQFRQLVSNRFHWHLTSQLSENSLMHRLDNLVHRIESAIYFESERWGNVFAPEFRYTINEWNAALTDLRVFIQNRTAVVLGHLENYSFPAPMTDVTGPAHQLNIPADPNLLGNFPNPFNQQTRIQYSLSRTDHVELAVYNLLGKKVRTLVNDIQLEGNYQILWNGLNEKNQSVSAGIYLYKLKTSSAIKYGKMVFSN